MINSIDYTGILNICTLARRRCAYARDGDTRTRGATRRACVHFVRAAAAACVTCVLLRGERGVAVARGYCLRLRRSSAVGSTYVRLIRWFCTPQLQLPTFIRLVLVFPHPAFALPRCALRYVLPHTVQLIRFCFTFLFLRFGFARLRCIYVPGYCCYR